MKRLLGALAGLILSVSASFAAQPAAIPVVASVAQMKALGAASVQYPTVNVTSYIAGGTGGGGIFNWSAASVATADDCNIITATGVPTGRWIRQIVPSQSDGVPLLNCGAVGDGTTDDSTAVTRAIAAIEATGKFGYIQGAQGYSFRVDTPFTLNILKEGLDCKNASLLGNHISSSATYIRLDSNTSNPYQNTWPIIKNCPLILGPSGGAPGTTGTGIYASGTTGSVAHVSIVDTGIAGFHTAILFGSNAHTVAMSHVSIFQNDDGISMPAGCSDCGENNSLNNGSSIFNNTRYAITIANPNGDLNVANSSIDYNQTAGSATACQVNLVDGSLSITGSHFEDFTHPVNCTTASTSIPLLSLTGNTYVRATGAASHLIDAGNGGYVNVNGGVIYAAVSPQTTIGAQAGGYMSVFGLAIGSAAFDTAAGTYYYCPTGSSGCSTNKSVAGGSITSNSFFSIPTGYTVATLPTPFLGTFTYITDGNAACTKNAVPVGGGSNKCPVWYNGSNWVEY